MTLPEIKAALIELRGHPDQDLEAHEWAARLLRKAYEISLEAGQYYEPVGEFCRPLDALLIVNRMLGESWSIPKQPDLLAYTELRSTGTHSIAPSQADCGPTIDRFPRPQTHAVFQSVDIATEIAHQVKAAFDYASSRISRAELARLAGVSKRTIDRKTVDGTLIPHRVGRRVTYDRNEALKALSNGHSPNPR